MSATKLTLFGPPRLERDGQPVDVSRRKSLAMLAYLAATGQAHSRDALAALFWPEAPQRRARGNLRRALSDLNRELGEGLLLLEGETVALTAEENLWLDVAQFQTCLAACAAHGHPPENPCPDCLPHLTEAANLYQADFLAGFTLRDAPEFDDWQYFEAEGLRQDLALTLERLVAGYSDQNAGETAIPYARRWVSLDSLHEPAQRALMQLYAESGQPAAALRQYEEYVKVLDEELGIPPEEETTTLYEAIKARRMLEPFLKAAQQEPAQPQSPLPQPDNGEAAAKTPPAETASGSQLSAQLGRYKLLSEIGRGGFAAVYRARDHHLDRLVALKELNAHLLTDTRWVRRFHREAKFIAHLDHPHIVTVFDVAQIQGRHFIVMRLVEGESLAQRLARQGRLTWPEAVKLISDVAAGLDYAHRRGILHRDLKPANILLDPERGPLLSDFGLATLADENSFSLNQSQHVVGTTHYIAPEVWDGQPATPQTDIYALGCVFYELLTSQKLFAGEMPPSVMRAHFQPLTLPQSWPDDVPAGLAEVLERTLAKEPGDRYPTAADFVAALAGLNQRQAAKSSQTNTQTILALAAQERDNGQYQAAIERLTARLPQAPADEAIHRELMRLYALAGQRHEALRQYQECVDILKTERNASPAPETRALYQQIINDDSALLTPAPSGAAAPPPSIRVEGHGVPLVGRGQELETIKARIQAACQGQGGTILLAGVSGVGKTRLAYEAMQSVASQGVTTLAGAAYEQEGHLAYHPFIEAFDHYLNEHRRPPDQNPITNYVPIGASDPQQENSALFKSVVTFLTGLAQGGPVVLLIDDLHAADEASLSLFHYLARQTGSAPLVLLATHRTDVGLNGLSPFGSLLNALYREQLSAIVKLAPLSEAVGAKIISHTLEGEAAPTLVKAILDIAEGNPFYIQEISRAMLKAEHLVREDDRWRLAAGATMQVPAQLRDLLRERVQRLGQAVETTLTAAAVIGREFRFALLRSVADLPDGTLFDALDDALAAHLIEETEHGYRFQHSLIRHALYDALNRQRRQWLHTRTAEAIEAAYGQHPEGLLPHVENLAYHYNLSHQQIRALPYLIQAARKARKVFAVEVANDYLERALALMDEAGIEDPAQRWPVLRRLGLLATTLADTSRAVARFEQALALPPTDTWRLTDAERVQVHRYAARALITAGQAEAAEQHLQNAMEIIADTHQASLDYANLLYDVALWHWHNNEYQEAFETAERSLDIAERLDNVPARARAYEMLALAGHSLGEWQDGLNYEQQRSTLVGPNLDVSDAFDVHL